VINTGSSDTAITPEQTRSLTKPAKRWWGVVLMKIWQTRCVVLPKVQILSRDARDCGEFCSKTSPIAAAHGAGTFIFKQTN
jgi:hypothetical protein